MAGALTRVSWGALRARRGLSGREMCALVLRMRRTRARTMRRENRLSPVTIGALIVMYWYNHLVLMLVNTPRIQPLLTCYSFVCDIAFFFFLPYTTP